MIDEKFYLINCFFNWFDFVDDFVYWNEKDFWVILIEFIVIGVGDCEDYIIVKYFLFIELGVLES